jgi:hypothetical protein
VLKLSDRTGQRSQRLPVITTQGAAQLGLANDSAKLFRHHQPGVIAPASIYQVPNLACHVDDPL